MTHICIFYYYFQIVFLIFSGVNLTVNIIQHVFILEQNGGRKICHTLFRNEN